MNKAIRIARQAAAMPHLLCWRYAATKWRRAKARHYSAGWNDCAKFIAAELEKKREFMTLHAEVREKIPKSLAILAKY